MIITRSEEPLAIIYSSRRLFPADKIKKIKKIASLRVFRSGFVIIQSSRVYGRHDKKEYQSDYDSGAEQQVECLTA